MQKPSRLPDKLEPKRGSFHNKNLEIFHSIDWTLFKDLGTELVNSNYIMYTTNYGTVLL